MRVVLGIVAAMVLGLVGLVGVLAVGVEWRDPAWRGWLERRLAESAGRPVRIDGVVVARLSFAPSLHLAELVLPPLDNPDAPAPAADRGRIGRLDIVLDPAATLRARLPDLSFIATDVDIAHGRDGGAGSRSVAARIERADGRIAADGPMALQAHGTVDGRPFRLDVEGGSLAGLGEAGASWPVAVAVEALGGRAAVDGTLVHAGGGSVAQAWTDDRDALVADLVVGVGAPDGRASAALLGVEWPALGAVALGGRVEARTGNIRIREAVGSAGRSRFDGEIDVVVGAGRPRIDGRLRATVLDLRPFLGQRDVEPAEPPTTLVQWYRALDDARLPLAGLRALDGRLEVAVDRWIGVPADVGPAHARIALADGTLDAPVEVDVAGVALQGDLHVAVEADGRAAAEVGLGAVDTPLGGLARWLAGVDDVRGALGAVAMRVAARGATVREIVDSAAVHLAVARGSLSIGHRVGERPVAFTIDSLVLSAPTGDPLAIDASGTLLEQPLQVRLRTDPLARIAASGASRLSLDVASRSVALAVDGGVAAGAVGAPTDGAALNVRLDAGDARDLGRWFGVDLAGPAPFALAARVRGTPADWRIEPLSLALGDNRLEAVVARRGSGDDPRWTIDVDVPRLDVDAIERLLARPAGRQAAPLSLDVPVLPAGLDFADLDLDVSIGEVSRSATAIGDLRFTTRIRDGYLPASPLSMTALGVPFSGALEIDLRPATPRARWWLASEEVDVGALLRRLQISERVDARFATLSVYLDATGRRLGDMLDASVLGAEITGGRIRIRDPNTGGLAGFDVASGSVVAAPGEPLRAAVVGRAESGPIALALTTGSLRQLVSVGTPIPVAIEAGIAGARLALDGELARPVGAGVRMRLSLAGDRVDDWAALAGVALPRWGPYAVDGTISVDAGGYRVDDARVSVGRSALAGDGHLDTTRTPPRLALRLDAPVVRIDDFPLDRDEAVDRAAPDANDDAPLGDRAARASDELQQLLSAEVLGRLDADVELSVGALEKGAGRLADARLRLVVASGRARFDPVAVGIGDGRLAATLDYAPQASGGVDAAIRLELDNVDYGVLARLVDPQTDVAGRIDARLALDARTPALSRAMADGDGSLRFLVRPQRMRADVFDLWASNLFVALVDRLDPESDTTVNCAVGEFALADGVLEAQRVLIDTTRVRVLGGGVADFGERRLSLRFDPWPKRPAFFSLATPIEVGGRFDDYTIGPRAGDVLATGLRLLGSVVWVPLMKLVGQPSPADGVDVCHLEPVGAPTPGSATDAPRSAPRADPDPAAWDPMPMLGGP